MQAKGRIPRFFLALAASAAGTPTLQAGPFPVATPLTRPPVSREMNRHGSPFNMPSMGEDMGMWCGRPKPGPKATAAPATVSGERFVNQPLGNREGDDTPRPASQETSRA